MLLNTELDIVSTDIPRYSAGHIDHEWTSWACIDVLFPFLERKYAEFRKSDLSNRGQSDEKKGDSTEESNKNNVDNEK